MKAKKLSLLLAIIMASSFVLGACAKDEKTTTTSSASSTAGVSSTKDDATATGERKMEGNMYVEGLPLVKETETFSIFCDDGGKAEEKIMYPILEEQTNVKVELMLYPNEIAIEKKNILINSGNYPDTFGGWILKEDEILNDGMRDGLYIAIDEMIEKYAPKMKEILDIKGVRQAMTLPDGHIYTIPYVIGEPLVTYNPFINIVWMEKLGLEMPTTTDEFTEVLRAFRDKDPNGNGKKDEIAFSGDSLNLNLGSLAGWWGTNAPQYGKTNFAMVDGKLEFTADDEGYKECMKYFASIYKEGLVDKELFTQDGSQFKAKAYANLYGCAVAYGGNELQEGLAPYALGDYRALPVLKGPGVEKPIYRRASYGSTTFRTQFVITDKAKNPATIVRWWDNVFQFDNSVQIQAGLEGVRVVKEGDTYRALDESKLSEADRTKYGWGNMFTQSLPKFIPPGFKTLDPVGVDVPEDQNVVRDKLYEPYLDELPATVWVGSDDAKKIAILDTDIKKYVDEKRAAWISGQADVDKDWDGYLKQLDKLGLQELIKIRVKNQEEAPKV